MAAERYGLRVLASRIEDHPDNKTRFLVIGRQKVGPSGRDKTSILVSTRNEPGALYRVLEPFHKHGISLTRIETRPREVRQLVLRVLHRLRRAPERAAHRVGAERGARGRDGSAIARFLSAGGRVMTARDGQSDVLDDQPYRPGKPIEELTRELGITDVIKLASNENPRGPGAAVREAIRACVEHLCHVTRTVTASAEAGARATSRCRAREIYARQRLERRARPRRARWRSSPGAEGIDRGRTRSSSTSSR